MIELATPQPHTTAAPTKPSFSWAAAADVGLGVLTGFAQGWAGNKVAKYNNQVIEAQNATAQSTSVLARRIQSLNNRRLLDAAEGNLGSAQRAFSRQQDAFARQGFEASVRRAEALGGVSARAAAAGVGGASVMAMAAASSNSLARQREYMRDKQDDATYEQLQAMAGIMPDAIRGMDNSAHVAQLNLNRQQSPGMLGALLNGLMSKQGSIQTLLGSMAGGGDGTVPAAADGFMGPPDLATAYPVRQGNVKGTPLGPGLEIGRVWEHRVTGTQLPPFSSINIK